MIPLNPSLKSSHLPKPGNSTLFAILLFILFINPSLVYSTELPVGTKVVAYHIITIPFNAYEETSSASKISIFFSKYGEMAKVAYPVLKENIITDTSILNKKCIEAMRQNINQIVKIQTENKDVNKYLTFDNHRSLLSKEDLLNIVTKPEEMTIQRDSAINKAVAEYRSKIFEITKNTAFSVYVTFICSYDNPTVEKIIISAVKLES